MPKSDPKPVDEMTPFEKGALAARLRMELKTTPARFQAAFPKAV